MFFCAPLKLALEIGAKNVRIRDYCRMESRPKGNFLKKFSSLLFASTALKKMLYDAILRISKLITSFKLWVFYLKYGYDELM